MNTNSYSMYEVLEEVRGKPTMYMGCKSILHLSTYLYGYNHAMEKLGVKNASQPKFDEFYDWVAHRLGYSDSVAGWANMILAETLGLTPPHPWESLTQSTQFE